MLVRSSALLDALYAMFELLWNQADADPVHARRRACRPASLPRACRKTPSDCIPLLAAGLNDKAIAHELGISASTLNRRMAELMKGVDARSRFQLGWLARALIGRVVSLQIAQRSASRA